MMGDSGPHHGESDWSWEEGEDDWQGTEDKIEREKKKKLQRYRRRKQLEERTANKGRHMLGLGPIRRQSIGYFQDAKVDFPEAKIMAVNEFLMEFLQISEDEMQDFTILDTMISKKEEDLIYVTFRDHSSIRDIHRRVAELQSEDIMVRNFIPPQYWERYLHLNRYCSKLKQEDKDIKFQIRFSEVDLEVLIKNRRKDENYYILPLQEISKEGDIPKFNHNITWTKRNDRPQREPLKPVKSKICPPSLRQETRQNSSPTSDPLQLSTSPSELQRKTSSSSSDSAQPKKKVRKQSDTRMDTDVNISNESI